MDTETIFWREDAYRILGALDADANCRQEVAGYRVVDGAGATLRHELTLESARAWLGWHLARERRAPRRAR